MNIPDLSAKYFGGKRYIHMNTYERKSQATYDADLYRKNGWFARVIKGSWKGKTVCHVFSKSKSAVGRN